MIAYTLQSNIFALLVLTIVYKGSKKQKDLSSLRDRLFKYILVANAMLLVIDSFSIFLYDVPGRGVYHIQSFLKMIFFSLNPIPGFLWMLYAYDFIYHNKKAFRRLFIVGIFPVIINILLSFASVSYGYLFIIGENNSYQRGQLFYLVPIFAFSYTIVSFFMVFLCRKRLQFKEWLPLLAFALPPIIGGLVQTFIYGMVTLWPSLSISLLIIYVFIQSKTIDTDFLTGLHNRRSFDTHIEGWKKWKKDDKLIAGFMMDMDDFKMINDNFGHQTGDKALIEMSRIIRESFRKKDFIVRLGGDEFAAIIEVDSAQEVETIKERLKEKISDFNRDDKNLYKLSLSFGSEIFDTKNEKSLSDFFDNLDKHMYEEKKQKKIGLKQ